MRGPCPCPHAGIDLIAAFYGCLYAGCVPVTVRPPHPQNIATTLPTVKMIVEVVLPVAQSWPPGGPGTGLQAPGGAGARLRPGDLTGSCSGSAATCVWTEGCRATWPRCLQTGGPSRPQHTQLHGPSRVGKPHVSENLGFETQQWPAPFRKHRFELTLCLGKLERFRVCLSPWWRDREGQAALGGAPANTFIARSEYFPGLHPCWKMQVDCLWTCGISSRTENSDSSEFRSPFLRDRSTWALPGLGACEPFECASWSDP